MGAIYRLCLTSHFTTMFDKFLRIFIAAALGVALSAQTPQPDKGKQMIDKAIEALGGDAFLHMRSREMSGRIYSFFHDKISGSDIAQVYTEYLDEPQGKGLQVREREVLGKKHDYSYLFLPDQAFDITFRGARPLPDDRWEIYSRSARHDILYLLRVRRNEPGMQFEFVGSDVLISTHVEIVDITDAAGETVRVYLDHNTMLPVRQSYKWLDAETRQHDDEVTDFDKWRDAGNGVKFPFTIERERNGYKVYQSFADKVEVNTTLPATIFDLPPGAKILKKGRIGALPCAAATGCCYNLVSSS